MNRRRFVCLLILVALLPAVAQEITLEQYLDRVQENHPFFNKEALKIAIEERGADAFLGGQEWNFDLTPSYSRLGEVSAGEIATGAEAADRGTIEVGAQRLFWSTGGMLGLGLSSSYSNLHFSGLSTESYSHGVNLSYAQPLLKNRGGALYRSGYDVSLFNAERVRVEIQETREAFLLEKAQKFLDWALAAEQIRIGERRLELAREQLGQVQRRFASNLVDRVDVLRGEDAVRAAEQGLLQLRSVWKATQAELAVLAGDPGLYDLSPAFDLFSLSDLPDVESDFVAIAENARVLEPLHVVLAQLAEQRRGLEEELRADLTLSVAAGLRGSDEKIADSLDILNPDFTIALEYKVPSAHVTTEARIASIQAQTTQIQQEMRSIGVELQAALRGLAVQITDMENILELGRQQIESAQQTTDEELKLYNQGRGSLTFVIRSRDNEQNARLGQARSAVLYHTLMLQYRALVDQLAP